jgi:hypothetical protein
VTAVRSSAIEAMATVARGLGTEQPRIVFVGGTVTALYPLEGGVDVRPTVDVDCVVDVATTAEYYEFVERLRLRGFAECTDEGSPLCRRVFASIRVDIVATADTGIGGTNRWYKEAVAEAMSHDLASDVKVLAITPIYFIATKLEAFRSRGGGDFQASHDLEDVLLVLAGLPALREQLRDESSAVASAVRRELVAFRGKEAFIDAVPGHFEGDAVGQRRADVVLEWLASLDK